MSCSEAQYREGERKKAVPGYKPAELGDYLIEVDMKETGPPLGAPDMNSNKFGNGFRRKQQSAIQQDRERKENDALLQQKRENRRELRKTFLEETKFQTKVNIITCENIPDAPLRTTKKVYSHHNVDVITKPLVVQRNLKKEALLANDGMVLRKKEYSVGEYFKSYSSYEEKPTK